MRINFETALEKIGRIVASQYNIRVIFEGSQAYTDGKVIVLPSMRDMSEELYKDMQGYLDHEVAHCKFSDFSPIEKCISKFHKRLLNMAEDSRIERLMIQEFRGCNVTLNALNKKLLDEIYAAWDKLPALARYSIGVRSIMEGEELRVDEDTEEFFSLTRELIEQLNDCKTTDDLRVKTEEIVKIISDAVEEPEEEKSEEESEEESEGEEHEESEEEHGESGASGEASETGGEDETGEEHGESEASETDGEGESGEAGEGDEESREGTEESGEETGDSRPETGKSGDPDREKLIRMIEERVDEEDSEWDEHITDVHGMMDEAIESEITDPTKDKVDPSDRTSLPLSTRYDTVTDWSNKGDPAEFSKMRSEFRKVVNPIRSELERILKVRENARTSLERERGRLHSGSLSKMITQRGYRTPFKEETRTETTNVAIQILIDLSGSMRGKPIKVAAQAASAMAEALVSLGISCEVTGFNSVNDYRLRSITNTKGFDRPKERLDLHVFKSFDSDRLIGLSEIFAGVQNPDGECVMWAAKRLANREEKRKILIVMSDGYPATGDTRGSILRSDLRSKIKIISKHMECVGIGIMSSAVEDFYKDHIVINNLEDLPRRAMQKLSSIILKGG